ncbi:hypothetical protein HNQ91_003361 [Filimonas zeae]|uniref:Uncharacterized protein n=1 Tax=Filimonas zeae TaxID=1737353 RepID=A0A917J052_9BACT|nr:hypothetical protein [Filimonas zeae]MDR6340296.1 hypothetical protein [Filimonas zeae]GGH72064.1 hypothetical protein GCM10011379_32090 [Filimonas zeae]
MKYRFRFQNTHGFKYLWLAALSPVLTGVLVSTLNIRDSLVVLCIVLVPLVPAFYLFARKSRARDEITVDDEGITSDWFGRINYASIEKAEGGSWKRTPPSLQLKLRNGHKVTWLLSWSGSVFNSREDAAVFSLFTEVLTGKMNKKEVLQGYPSKNDVPYSAAAAQVEQAVIKNRKGQSWFFPVSLVFAILALVRTCGKDWFLRKDPDFAAVAQYQKQELQSNLAKVKEIMAEKMAHYGPVYLYTNDTAARLELLPDIELAEMTPQLSLFQNGMMNESLRKFIKHPDDYDVITMLVAGNGDAKPMQKSIFNKKDSISRYLHFRIFVPQNGYPPTARKTISAGRDTAQKPDLQFATAIPLYDTVKLSEAIDNALPNTHMLLAQLRFNTGCKVYITGSAHDSIPETVFRKVMAILDEQRKQVKADSIPFVFKTWHHGILQ